MREMIERLYLTMPGAPLPPKRSGLLDAPDWSRVEGNEHWRFCEQIAIEIISAAQAYVR